MVVDAYHTLKGQLLEFQLHALPSTLCCVKFWPLSVEPSAVCLASATSLLVTFWCLSSHSMIASIIGLNI